MTEQPPVSRTLRQAEARKRHAQPPDARTYAVARLCMRTLFKVCVGPTVLGLEHVPHTGPLLIVANHLSYLEPPLLTALLPRRITYLALHELFEVPWLAPVLRLLGALPVKRGGARDLDALRAALTLLDRGHAVAIFPEGQRSIRPGLLHANPGISLLATRSNAPILPVAVTGTEWLQSPRRFITARRHTRVQVTIGPPFQPEIAAGRPDHQLVADQIMLHIASILPPRYQGAYRTRAGEP